MNLDTIGRTIGLTQPHVLDADGNDSLSAQELGPGTAQVLRDMGHFQDGSEIAVKDVEALVRVARANNPAEAEQLDRADQALGDSPLAKHEKTSRWLKLGGIALAGVGLLATIFTGGIGALPFLAMAGGGGAAAFGFMRKPPEGAEAQHESLRANRRGALENLLAAEKARQAQRAARADTAAPPGPQAPA